ncbi:MAG: PQQ-binding-like beta-propeller repeat protein [Methanomicrobiales archaeon]
MKNLYLLAASIAFLLTVVPAIAISPSWVIYSIPDENSFPAEHPVAISSDGSVLAELLGNSVYLIDLNGTILWNYSATDTLRNVVMSGDGQTIAAASWDNELIYFDRDKHPKWSMKLPDNILALAISGDGKFLVSGEGGTGSDSSGNITCIGRDGAILWSYPTPAPVVSLVMSDDGKYVAAGGNGYSLYQNTREPDIYFLDNTGRQIWSARTLGGNSVAMDPGARSIAIGTRGKNIISLYNRDGTRLWTYPTPSEVTSVSISPDGEYVYAAISPFVSNGMQVPPVVLSINRKGSLAWTYPESKRTQDDWFTALHSAKNATVIATGSSKGNITLIGADGKALEEYRTNELIEDFALSGDGRMVIARGLNSSYFFESGINSTTAIETTVPTVRFSDNTGSAQPVTGTASPRSSPFSALCPLAATGMMIIAVIFRRV